MKKVGSCRLVFRWFNSLLVRTWAGQCPPSGGGTLHGTVLRLSQDFQILRSTKGCQIHSYLLSVGVSKAQERNNPF
ncbi:hypothetical protein RRG08_030488 [Elysia crispata]|uniref:Secreted protein n=1 Tax=Elysia crispata TaxID=231223 RepID=A0AAE1AKI9_9GAST|nr:hypothetical protein RRG08_030488 [Elysia crispata]